MKIAANKIKAFKPVTIPTNGSIGSYAQAIWLGEQEQDSVIYLIASNGHTCLMQNTVDSQFDEALGYGTDYKELQRLADCQQLEHNNPSTLLEYEFSSDKDRINCPPLSFLSKKTKEISVSFDLYDLETIVKVAKELRKARSLKNAKRSTRAPSHGNVTISFDPSDTTPAKITFQDIEDAHMYCVIKRDN